MTLLRFFILSWFISVASAMEPLRALSASEDTVQKDLTLILKAANLTGMIQFEHIYDLGDYTSVQCAQEKIILKVHSLSKEWSSSFYYALQKLGFLFPHPRWQISPSKKQMFKQCGRKIFWKPALSYRGFHLHTLHPNEWVAGFLGDKTKIATDTIRWLARNQQNIFDISLLRIPNQDFIKNLKAPFKLAKNFGIHAGVAVGIAFHQQNSFKLVSLLGAFSDSISTKEIKRNLARLLEQLDISFLNVEAGTSEFTPVDYNRSLMWLNLIAKMAKKSKVKMLTKVHVSSNQKNEKFGNFNYLPQHAHPDVGILPHTVFAYSLMDENAPMYGNKNFHGMQKFLLEQKEKRRAWYYPETSYWIGMDIGVPLYHLEYLRARAQDMAFLKKNNISGQLNFSSGQELGYWLFDWSVSLMNNLHYKFDPLIGVKLLKLDPKLMQEHMQFHREYFTEKQLVSILTFSNPADELFPSHQIHKRNFLKDLVNDKEKLQSEIYQLASALAKIPSTKEIQQEEIKTLLDISYARISHALYVRKAIMGEKEKNLKQAKLIRESAAEKMNQYIQKFNRYPEAKVFERFANPTAYQFGYGHTAKTLHHWRREETKVEKDSYSAFTMNIYDLLDIVL